MRSPLLAGALGGLLAFAAFWTTIAVAYDQSPVKVHPRDAWPFASGALLFAGAGMAIAALGARGWTRALAGAVGGALVGYAGSVLHLLFPYLAAEGLPAVLVLASGLLLGAAGGFVADLRVRVSGASRRGSPAGSPPR